MRARFGLLGRMGFVGGDDKRSGRCIRGTHDEDVSVRQVHVLCLYGTNDDKHYVLRLCGIIAGEYDNAPRA